MEDYKTANWYKELLEIDSKDKIIGFAYGDVLYKSFEEVKEKIDYMFDDGYGLEKGFHFTAWTADRI